MTRNLEPRPAKKVVAEPASFQSVAKRCANFATNVLVTGVILVVGLVFGREVISWWRGGGSPSETLPTTASVGDRLPPADGRLQLLEFGDFPFVLNRQEFEGDVEQALAQLRTLCRTAVDSSQPLAGELGPAEQRMLDAAERLTPVEQRANRGAIYQIDKPLPMVVGVRRLAPQVAVPDRRVVSWGLAVPDATPAGTPQSEWTLFTYLSDTTAETTHKQRNWPSPPGGRRTLSVGSHHGGAMVGYAGVGTMESWTTFYDELFSGSRSQPRGEWQVDFGNWRRRFARVESETIDVVIRHNGAGTLHALVLISPDATPDP